MKSFIELGVSPPILKALEEMGFDEPTEVQEMAIPHILNNEDLIVRSKTGSGKTAVYGVSILQMTDPAKEGPQGLILTPTRELAVQVDSDLKKISAHLEHRTTAVYGQHNMHAEITALKNRASIVTGTPGRVFDHIEHGNLVTRNIRFLVLDEADRMLDMGFIGQVLKIMRKLPKNRITLLFSATIPPEVHRICTEYMTNPVTIEIESQTKTVDTIQQVYYRVNRNEKRTQLNRLLLYERPDSCIIFCNTKIAVDQVQSFLSKKGYASHALHGDIPQGTRMKTMEQFKQSDFRILVATDVAARGIHIDDLSLVINYDIPVEKDSYIHRIGRTGRAGNGGRAISLVTGDDLMTLYEIEEHIGALIEEVQLPADAVLDETRAEAELWVQAHALKNKPSQASGSSIEKDDSREFRQKKSSLRRRGTGNRPASTSQAGDNQQDSSRQVSDRQESNSQASGQRARTTRQSFDRQARSAGQAANNQQESNGKTGQEIAANRQSGYRRESNQPTGSARRTGYSRQEAGQQPGSDRQSGYGRESSQSAGSARPTSFNRRDNGQQPETGRQSGYTRQEGRRQASCNQHSGNHRLQSGQQSEINRQPESVQRNFYKRTGSSSQPGSVQQNLYRNVKPGTQAFQNKGKLARLQGEKRQNAEPAKKESFIKRLFYRIFGK